ncbi:hypothetical protein [Alkalimonas amylolytica]|uniref:Uncharacterized protein n=1 Tax=Alkalimonas amylolytica TaxID=152573 RepID=A0A1H3Z467_ALKAM|nr:hypothetical protein [Alkalimonas amylolytica]SEA18072.1 hypothetical protein SAMN04488051_1023 [Alkalimonas amylolytica]
MLTTTSLPDQANLLLLQREQMSRSRYVGLQQLRQQDQRLVSHLRILQQGQSVIEYAETPWLHWLLQPGEHLTALLQAELSACFRAYLWQLKAYIQQFPMTPAIQQLLQQEPANAGGWSLVLHCPEHFQPIIEQLPLTQAPIHFMTAYRPQHALQQITDWQVFVEQLCSQRSDSFSQLSILMMHASPQQKLTIINVLSKQHDHGMTMLAMALSGQFKYLPVLVELASDATWSEAAADSLSILLGVLAADAVIADGLTASDPAYLQQAFLQSGAVFAQKHAEASQLEQLWQRGNQWQRQLAAIKAALQWSTVPVVNGSALWGGAWHTAFV